MANKDKNKVAVLRERYENYKFNTPEPILDIGGGNGSFLKSQGINDAVIVEGGIYTNSQYKYIHADLTKKLPEFKQKFKTIFIMEVLEHLKNPLYLLSQVYDILDDKGVCYIAIPYTEIGVNHHHVCRWKLREIKNQLSKLGFVSRTIQKRRRFRGVGFFLPHCWLVLALKKQKNDANQSNIRNYNLKLER